MKENEKTGGQEIQCLCKTLNPTTIITDLKGIFSDSKIDEVFSGEGLSALLSVEYYRLYIFYVLVFKTAVFLVCLKVAHNRDLQDIKIASEVKKFNLNSGSMKF